MSTNTQLVNVPAPVPNAEVQLINAATGTSAATKSNAAGLFVFPSVLAGSYRLQATAGAHKFALDGLRWSFQLNFRIRFAFFAKIALRLSSEIAIASTERMVSSMKY